MLDFFLSLSSTLCSTPSLSLPLDFVCPFSLFSSRPAVRRVSEGRERQRNVQVFGARGDTTVTGGPGGRRRGRDHKLDRRRGVKRSAAASAPSDAPAPVPQHLPRGPFEVLADVELEPVVPRGRPGGPRGQKPRAAPVAVGRCRRRRGRRPGRGDPGPGARGRAAGPRQQPDAHARGRAAQRCVQDVRCDRGTRRRLCRRCRRRCCSCCGCRRCCCRSEVGGERAGPQSRRRRGAEALLASSSSSAAAAPRRRRVSREEAAKPLLRDPDVLLRGDGELGVRGV